MEGFWLELHGRLCKPFMLSSCPGPVPKPELAGDSAKTDAAVVPDVLGMGAAAEDMDACSAANGVTAGARASCAPAPTVSSVEAHSEPHEMYKGANFASPPSPPSSKQGGGSRARAGDLLALPCWRYLGRYSQGAGRRNHPPQD